MAKIQVLNKEITIQTQNTEDYISLTDIGGWEDGTLLASVTKTISFCLVF